MMQIVRRIYVVAIVFFFLILPLLSQECNVGMLQYQPEGNCKTKTKKCCAGAWGEWGEEKCICAPSLKPKEKETCVSSCGTRTRSVTCDETTGIWATTAWSSCEGTVAECCNSSVPKTSNLCYKDCTERVVVPYGEAKTIRSGRFFCTSMGGMTCSMQGPEESRCYGFPRELQESGRPPGVYKCRYILHSARRSGTCEFSSQYCQGSILPGSGHRPVMTACSGPCLYGIGTDGRGDGTTYDELEISYKLSFEKGRCKVPGW